MHVMSKNVIELKYALIQISSVFSPSIEQAASKPCSKFKILFIGSLTSMLVTPSSIKLN